MLSSLRLRNFRCFATLHCPLAAGTSVFIGENAQGKTSVLEAVCLLLRLQSPRTTRPTEVVKFGGQEFGVAGTWGKQELKHTQTNGVRQLWVGGVATSKPAQYLEASGLVVWMGNGDLELVTGSGEPRRRYLDFLGVQLFPDYRVALSRYEKALKTRNFLLKRRVRAEFQRVALHTFGQRHDFAINRCVAEGVGIGRGHTRKHLENIPCRQVKKGFRRRKFLDCDPFGATTDAP